MIKRGSKYIYTNSFLLFKILCGLYALFCPSVYCVLYYTNLSDTCDGFVSFCHVDDPVAVALDITA